MNTVSQELSPSNTAVTSESDLSAASARILEMIDDWVTIQWCARSTGEQWRAAVDQLRAAISSAKPLADRGPGTPPEPPIAKAQPQPERS